MKKWIIIIGIPVLLTLLVFHLARTEFLLNRVEVLIPELTNGALKVDDIKGNLLYSIKVYNFRVGETVTIDSLTVRYSPLSLIRRRVYHASLGRMVIDLETSNGLPDPLSASQPRQAGRFEFPLDIDKVRANELRIIEVMDDEMILYQVSGSIARARKGMSIVFNLDGGRWMGVSLASADGNFSYLDGEIALNELTVNTEESHFLGDLILKDGRFNLNVERSHISLSEFAHIIGQDICGFLYGPFEMGTGLAGKGEQSIERVMWRGYVISGGNASWTMKDDIIDLRLTEVSAYGGRVNGRGEVTISPFSYNLNLHLTDVRLEETLNIPGSVSGEVSVCRDRARLNVSSNLYGREIENIRGILSFDGEIDVVVNEKLNLEGRLSEERLSVNISSEGLDISPFLPVRGDLFGDGMIKGSFAEPELLGSFYIQDFHYGKIHGEYISSNFIVNLPPSRGRFDFAGLAIRAPNMEMDRIEGHLHLAPVTVFSLTGEGEGVSLAIAGDIEKGFIRIDTLIYTRENIRVENHLPVSLIVKYPSIFIDQSLLHINGGTLELSGGFEQGNLDITVTGDELPLSLIRDVQKGFVDISLKLKGPILSPSIQAGAQLTDLIIEGIMVDTVKVTASYSDSLLVLDKAEIVIGEERSNIKGSIPLLLSPLKIPEGELSLSVSMKNLPPSIWNLFQNIAFVKSGETDIEMEIGGNSSSPDISGWADIRDLSLDIPLYGITLQDINSRVRFVDGRVVIDELVGASGEGEIGVEGEIVISGLAREEITLALNITGDEIPFRVPEGEGEADMDINLSGSLAHPEIKGRLKIERAEVLLAAREEITAGEAEYEMDLDIELSRVWIRAPLPAPINPIPGIENPLVVLEMEGNLSIVGRGREMFLTGDMEVKQGYFYYIDRPFKIEEGRFVFDNILGFNPLVTLKARCDIVYRVVEEGIRRQDTTVVYITLDGRMSALNFSIYSEPSLPLDGIITLLSLNVPSLHALFDQWTVTDVPDRLLNLLIRGTVLSQIEDLLGVDALWFETALLGEEKKARVTAGKYISPDLYASYTRDLFSPTWSFKTSYHLFRGISLTGERTEEDEYGAGLEIEIRY